MNTARSCLKLAPALLVLLIEALAGSPASAGELPSTAEKIVFQCNTGVGQNICTMNPDGSGRQQLTDDSTGDQNPEISPDGTMIAWGRDITELAVMNIDGTGRRLINEGIIAAFGEPTWSPDGKMLLFSCNDPANLTVHGFCTINLDGSGFQMVKAFDYEVRQPDYSPDGDEVLFQGYETSIVNPDLMVWNIASGQVRNLTNTPERWDYGQWSPDGDQIAFAASQPAQAGGLAALFLINPDGSNRELLYQPQWGADAGFPAWSPKGDQIALFCDIGVIGGTDLCVVDSSTGALDDSAVQDDELRFDPHWARTGGARQGNVDCTGGTDAIDALKVQRFVSNLPVSHNEPCPDIGEEVASLWGDVDCDDDVDSVDALKILRAVASLSVAQAPGCPRIGTFIG
jgi:Tol biopolymer transport system component